MRFSEIISLEDQYHTAQARASIAFHTSLAAAFVFLLREFLDVRLGRH